jgi:hypothetical protein
MRSLVWKLEEPADFIGTQISRDDAISMSKEDKATVLADSRGVHGQIKVQLLGNSNVTRDILRIDGSTR